MSMSPYCSITGSLISIRLCRDYWYAPAAYLAHSFVRLTLLATLALFARAEWRQRGATRVEVEPKGHVQAKVHSHATYTQSTGLIAMWILMGTFSII